MNNKNNVYNNIIKKKGSPYFIAEIGINHNGNYELAKKMVQSAKESGADCVKFQSFKAEKYISVFAQKANYQLKSKLHKSNSQLEIIKNCEFSIEKMKKIKKFCHKINIDFLCTPFEIYSFKELLGIGEKTIKISSCNLTNIPFLREVSKHKVQSLLSTGMSNFNEVVEATSIFEENKVNIGLFQCTSNYPSKFENSNLNVIDTYKKIFNYPIGFSDHNKSSLPAIVATTLGISMIEKHFTLSRKLPGVDQAASIEPKELKELISDLKKINIIKGDNKKNLCEEEINTQKSLRRSLVASRFLKAGRKIKKSDISIKRPGTGISPKYLDFIIGKTIKKSIFRDQILTIDNLLK